MLKILTIVLILVVCYLVVFFAYKRLAKKIKIAGVVVDDSCAILGEITTNNTYPLMLDVFTSLNQNLAECGADLHADLRGYLDYGKAE